MKAPGGSKRESNNTHYLFWNGHAAAIRAEIKSMKEIPLTMPLHQTRSECVMVWTRAVREW